MTGQQAPMQQTKVLVSEDNQVILKGLVKFLKQWGFEPIEVDNGDDAMKILESDHSIRLAIVDWNMPGLSGLQVCQRLRIRKEGPYVYVIMFSARKSLEEKILALEGGADEYLVKPCKPSELRVRLGVGRRILETLQPLLEDPRSADEEAALSESEEKQEKGADDD